MMLPIVATLNVARDPICNETLPRPLGINNYYYFIYDYFISRRDVEAEAVLFLWKQKRENSTASAST